MTIQFAEKPTMLMSQKKEYLDYKCQTPGRGFRRPLVLPQGAPQWELNPFPSRFLHKAAPTGGFALPPDPSHLSVFLRGTIFLGNVSLWGKKTS